MKKIIIGFVLGSLLFPTIAFAIVLGPSNLGILSEYPKFSKYRPTTPYSKDSYSMSSYKTEVEFYVADAERYLEACKNDIQRIVENADDARRSANSVIREYNSF